MRFNATLEKLPRQQQNLVNVTLNRPLEEKIPKANNYALTHWLLEAACSVVAPLCCSECRHRLDVGVQMDL